MEQLITPLRITGLLALLGALLYAIGDVLLLASKASLDDYPKLKPFAKLLSDAEKMVVLSPKRMIWGALLGVFATPLVVSGFWQVYQGLRRRERVCCAGNCRLVWNRIHYGRIRTWNVLLHGRICSGVEQRRRRFTGSDHRHDRTS